MTFSLLNLSKKILRNVIITLLFTIYCSNNVCAFDLDMTVDDEIRKNYNSSKLIDDTNSGSMEQLPALPEYLKQDSLKNVNQKAWTKTIEQKSFTTKITKGTSFNVINTHDISDWKAKGTTVTFKTKYPITKKKYIIPSGTVFKGEIIEVHQPQLSCNGGLVAIRVRSMLINNQTVPINAYITKANDKLIFFNNIKGERTYLKTVWKKGNPGRSLFNKMLTLTVNFGGDGSTFLLSPFPFSYGTVCFGVNTLISPITAFFEKGKHVSIKSGSAFKIKLSEDAFIY